MPKRPRGEVVEKRNRMRLSNIILWVMNREDGIWLGIMIINC